MTLPQISKFEKLNSIFVNVFTVQEQSIVPLRLTKEKQKKHVNLLYMSENNEAYFVYIKNSRLVNSQLSKREHKHYICDRCLHYFRTSEKLAFHATDCGKMNNCTIVLRSDENKWLSFSNLRTFRVRVCLLC